MTRTKTNLLYTRVSGFAATALFLVLGANIALEVNRDVRRFAASVASPVQAEAGLDSACSKAAWPRIPSVCIDGGARNVRSATANLVLISDLHGRFVDSFQ